MRRRPGLLIAAAALVVAGLVAAAPAAAGKLSRAERTMFDDPAKAAQVVAGRIQHARDLLAAAQAEPVEGREGKKIARQVRFVEGELEKAQFALDGGDYRAAYVFANRAERLAQQLVPEVQR
jgi:hypothetical protein